MKKLSTLCISALYLGHLYGQNQPWYTLYDACKDYYNPAFTAYEGKNSVYIIGSHEYAQLSFYDLRSHVKRNAVVNYTAGISMPILTGRKQRLGIGLNYARQNERYMDRTNLRFKLSYGRHVGAHGQLMAGANVDMINDRHIYPENYYYYFSAPIRQSWQTFNTGLGAGYHSSTDNFYIGISTNFLVPHRLHTEGDPSDFVYFRELYIISGIDMRLSNKFKLRPSMLIAEDKLITTIIPGIQLAFREKFLLGFLYDSREDRWGGRLGVKLKNFSMHYVYGRYISKYDSVTGGKHTVGISYAFGKDKGFAQIPK